MLHLSSLVIHTHLLLTNESDAIYAVGAAKSAASYTPFSPPLPSSIAKSLFEFMVLNRNDTEHHMAGKWLGEIKPSTAGYAQNLDVGFKSERRQLVATREDGASRILKQRCLGPLKG